MRNRSRGVAVSLLFVFVLSSSSLAAAPSRDGDGFFERELETVVRFVKAIAKRVGIVTYSDGMTPPKP